MHRDSKDRLATEESFLYQEKLLHCPLVNQCSTIFRDIFATFHNPIPLWPSNKKCAVALTHDVDYPEMIRWIEAVRYLAKYKRQSKMRRLLDVLTGEESFWRFEGWIELERRYGMKSTSYFCGFKGGLLWYLLKAPDPFYDVRRDRFRRTMNYLVQNGFEVGMHSSYLAYQSASRFRTEKIAVEEVLGKPVLGNRHHYWHMNPTNTSKTALIHSRIGLLYDSSIAFSHRAGFRYGICSPFHLYDSVGNQRVITLELRPTLMDDHLFQYAKYSYFGKYQFEIDALLDPVRKHGGIFVADYHVRGLNDTFFPRWGESYKYLLSKINESTLLHPEYRGSGLFQDLYKFAISLCKDRGMQCIWGYTAAFEAFRKAGFRTYGHAMHSSISILNLWCALPWVREQNIGAVKKVIVFLMSLPFWLYSSMHRATYWSSHRGLVVRERLADQQDLDNLYERLRNRHPDMIHIDLDERYLQRRIYNHPIFKYRTYFVYEGDLLKAYAFVNTHDKRMAYLTDLTFESVGAGKFLLRRILSEMRAECIGAVMFLATGQIWQSVRPLDYSEDLGSCKQNPLCILCFETSFKDEKPLFDVTNWYMNGLWTEGYLM